MEVNDEGRIFDPRLECMLSGPSPPTWSDAALAFGETSLPGLSAKLVSHRDVHPYSQPILPEGCLSAPAARIMEIMKPGLASPLALGQAVASAWLARHSFPREAFAEAAEACMLGMLRPRSKRGFTTRRLDVITSTLVIIRTVLDLQFELLHRGRRPAKWAARIARLMLPSDLQLLVQDSPIMVMRLRYLLTGISPEGDGVVYALCASAAFYIGKTIRVRSGGHPGVAARFSEHVRALLHPAHPDGGRPRYKMLRAEGLRALRFFPVLVTSTPAQALAAEGIAIKAEAPSANRREVEDTSFFRMQGAAVRFKGSRRRPPSWLRRRERHSHGGSPLTSLWTSPIVLAALAKAGRPSAADRVYPGALGLQVGFSELYRAQQRRAFALHGSVGPLSIFLPEQGFLFLCYAAAQQRKVGFPSGWSRDRCASFLYGRVRELGLVAHPSKRAKAGRLLARMLRAHRLPPHVVPPARIEGSSARFLRPQLVRAMSSMASALRCQPAREWLRGHLRIAVSASRKWSQRATAPRVCPELRRQDLLSMSSNELGRALGLSSLSACDGPWRLPMWPSQRSVVSGATVALARWATRSGAPASRASRGCADLRHAARRRLEEFPLPPCPRAWAALQEPLEQFCAPGYVLFPDDKEPSRMWRARSEQLHANLLQGLLLDRGTWQPTELSLDTLRALELARGLAGLPSWLRAGASPLAAQVRPPTMFPLCKSKCYAPTGQRLCAKPRHSCMRRVVNCAGLPFRHGWRIAARALRGILMFLGLSCEVFDPTLMRPLLDDGVARARSNQTASCLRCACSLTRPSVVTADVDQAFEACSSSLVWSAFVHFATIFRERFATSFIMVSRGSRPRYKMGARGFGGAAFCMQLDVLGHAVLAYTFCTFVACGDMVFRLAGIAMGGILGTVCVAYVLGAAEHRWISDSAAHARAGFRFQRPPLDYMLFLRFVDDVLLISYALCPGCLLAFASSAYPVRLSPCSGFGPPGESHVWTDIVIMQRGWDLFLAHKNPNRDWLFRRGPRQKTSFDPWPGSPPLGFAALRARICGRLHRCSQLGFSPALQALRVSEDILEMWLSGYPLALLRALAHSLPASPASLRLRHLMRGAMRQDRADRQHRQWPQWDAQAQKKQDERPPPPHTPRHERDPQRFADRTKTKKKRRDPSSSSSSSSDSKARRRQRRVDKAAALLSRHDPDYQTFLRQAEENRKQEHVNQQAEAFRMALQGTFDAMVVQSPLGAPVLPACSQPQVPQAPPTPQAPPVVEQPRVAAPSGGHSGPPAPSDELSVLQARFLEAEFGHSLAISDRKVEAVIALLIPLLKATKNNKSAVALVTRLAPGTTYPAKLLDRARLVVDLVHKQ